MNYLIWLGLFMVLPLTIMISCIMFFRKEIITSNLDVIWRSTTLIYIIGYLWDFLAVNNGWWFYEKQQIIGIWFLGLPIEEHLFIILTTLFYVILTLLALTKWGDKK